MHHHVQLEQGRLDAVRRSPVMQAIEACLDASQVRGGVVAERGLNAGTVVSSSRAHALMRGGINACTPPPHPPPHKHPPAGCRGAERPRATCDTNRPSWRGLADAGARRARALSPPVRGGRSPTGGTTAYGRGWRTARPAGCGSQGGRAVGAERASGEPGPDGPGPLAGAVRCGQGPVAVCPKAHVRRNGVGGRAVPRGGGRQADCPPTNIVHGGGRGRCVQTRCVHGGRLTMTDVTGGAAPPRGGGGGSFGAALSWPVGPARL